MDERPEIYELETVEQLRAVADPLRLRIIEALDHEARTATQVGELLDLPANKVHYHVRELERVGLVRLVDSREKGGILEKYFLTVAPSLRLPSSLLNSLPPDESAAALAEFLQMIGRDFMQAFTRRLRSDAREGEGEPLALSGSNLWMTDQECRATIHQIDALLKPFEERRRVAGERQRTFVLMAHTSPIGAWEEPGAAQTTPAPAAPAGTGIPDDGPVPTAPATSAAPAHVPTPQIPPAVAERAVTIGTLKRGRTFAAGALYYSRADLERVLSEGTALDIALFGYCAFAADVSADLAERAIARFRHRGVLHASPEVRAVLKRKET